jgi:acyl-CoA synthetase (AMP-forming)/AMP-acid ligase II/thioesterase domain-containing protein
MSVQLSPADLHPLEPEIAEFRALNTAQLLLRAAQEYSSTGIGFAASDRDSSEFLTHSGLLEEARRILGGLQIYHRRPGDTIALVLERARDFIPTYWACVLGGYIPCPIAPIRNDPARWAKHLAHIDALLDEPLFVTTSTLRDELPENLPSVDLSRLRESAPLDVVYEASPEAAAVLMLTSGSTGHSKAVALTHANLLSSMAAKTRSQGLQPTDITLNWISFEHVAALLEVHLVSLYVGATQVNTEAATILADPLLFLRLIDRHRVTVTFTPNFLLGQINSMLEAAQLKGAPVRDPRMDLSCVRHIVSGGEANVVETGVRFLELLEPNGLARSVLRPAFGMTETCGGSIYSRHFPDMDVGCEFASVGAPVEGLQIRIVNETGGVVPSGHAGELQLRGPMIFPRYYNNADATATAFTSDGWFRTGDLGRIADGQLTLVGRSKDSIIVSGVNYYAHELEAVLNELEGVERSFVAVFPTRPPGADTEQLVITFATTFPLEDEERLHQLNVAVRNTTILLWGFRPAWILPLPRDAFPKTSLGKIQRSLLRKRLEDGELAGHQEYVAALTQRQLGGYVVPQGPTELAVASVFAELFGLDPGSVSATASFFDLGGTSLDILKLTHTLPSRFPLSDVPVASILQSPTVRALAERLVPRENTGGRKYDPIVPLQITGSKAPLFVVHPGIGEVLVFVSLAKYFVNERPFYALRARGFDPGESHFSSLAEMVDSYLAAVRARQPHGPYALAGYSLGGPIAVEMARVLETQGEQVAFIGCIDGPPCDRVEPLDEPEIAVSLAFFLSLIDKRQLRELPGLLRSNAEDVCAYLFSHAPARRLTELNLDLPKFRAWAALSYSLNAVSASYVRASDGPCVEAVTVFYAEPLRYEKEDWLSRLKDWDRFTRVPTRYIEVGGDHASLLGPKHVGAFQATFRAEIERSMAATGGGTSH